MSVVLDKGEKKNMSGQHPLYRKKYFLNRFQKVQWTIFSLTLNTNVYKLYLTISISLDSFLKFKEPRNSLFTKR